MNKPQLLPEESRKNISPAQCEAYCQTLKKMVDCQTVYRRDGSNDKEFQRFYQVIEESFPLISQRAQRLCFGTGCFVYVIAGENPTKNIMLMSHHDVVEGGEGWQTDPFAATVQGDSLYGRGTIDTKTPLFAQLQACEELLAEGYTFPGMNVYIGSSNNEEVCGDGMVLAVSYFQKQGIHFDVVLDEGGAITTGMIPGITGKSAMVAVHEKSRHMFRCTTSRNLQGHGGLNPSKDNAIVRMSQFIQAVEKARIYKSSFAPEVRATFEKHAPYMAFPYKLLFGHFGIFGPLLKQIMSRIPQASAMLSTSISFTSIFGGSHEDPQIQAKNVEATMFLRCVREEDLYQGLEKIKAIAKDYQVEIEELYRDYCTPTSFTEKPYQILEEVLRENFPDVIVAPFLLTAGTDARRFTDVADNILRFAPIDLDKAQYASIHSANEHIKIANIGQCVLFYKDVVKRLTGV